MSLSERPHTQRIDTPSLGTTRFPPAQAVMTRTVIRGRTWLVFDLTWATDLSADFLELLLDLDRTARERGLQVLIVRPAADAVSGLIRCAALDLTIPVFDSRADAVAWARAGL